MEEKNFKTFSYLLCCVVIFQLVYSTNRQFQADAIQSDLQERMKSMEAKNRLQEREVSTLKTNLVEDRKEVHQLRGRVALLEASTSANSPVGKKVGRPERPVRLLPPHIL